MTKRIDGKARADRLVADVAAVTAKLKSQAGIAPGLCAVLVGEDPASQVYVRNKGKAAVAAGIASFQEMLPATITEAELLALIGRLNADDRVDGARAQRNRRSVGENPTRRGLVGANFKHGGRPLERNHRLAALGQSAGVIAGTGADFENRLSAQRPQSCNQRVGDRRLDASRFVISGGNLAIVDGGRYWHDGRLDDGLKQTMRPRQV